jgi:diphthamide biosynthesis methyltransferase
MVSKKNSFKHIDERKDTIYKELLNSTLKKRDEKALKKRAKQEVEILNRELFKKKKPEQLHTSNIVDELLLFIGTNK